MAIPTDFGHDNLGHLLSDRLLTVPRFQRGYSWTEQHVSEYWSDIARARSTDVGYFMGTIVLAEDLDTPGRMLIVDGQQRITTTAILLIAIRDRLYGFDLDDQWRAVEREYLSDYVLVQEAHKPKLVLSPTDAEAFEDLLDVEKSECRPGLVLEAYKFLKAKVDVLAPTDGDYAELINLVVYLSSSVQVLTATATDLSEAFVIFETLNDRGADLTTADLLKNFLFSMATSTTIRVVEEAWVRIAGYFSRPTDFVRFIRYEHMSRKGHVTMRGLYKAIQSDIPTRPGGVSAYLTGLEATIKIYLALKEPDDAFWSANSVNVKDALLAFRRLGLEVNSPLLLAAFTTWPVTNASKLVNIVANWSVRAWAAGNLGGGTADTAFCGAAEAITKGQATTSDQLKPFMKGVVPEDSAFRTAFAELGSVNTTVAKYLLGQLERQSRVDAGENVDAMPDWASRSVTIEHIIARSTPRTSFTSDEEFEAFEVVRDRLGNLSPLEVTLNADAKDSVFVAKKHLYEQSQFALTKSLAGNAEWTLDNSIERSVELASLAMKAWPF
jgi:hypothetical protein